MRYVKFLLVPMLFVSLAFMNIGGCNGSDGGGGNVTPTDPPPTNTPPTDPTTTMAPPTDPPPTNPPPTDPPPPGTCQIPALNTDFSDELYIFIDSAQGLLIGITSDGVDVIAAILDSFGTSVGFIAEPIGEFACLIDLAIVDELVFNADGLCGRSDDATLFLILDFSIGASTIIDESLSECDFVEPIPSTSDADIAAAMRSLQNELVINNLQEPMDFSNDFNNAFDAFQINGLIE